MTDGCTNDKCGLRIYRNEPLTVEEASVGREGTLATGRDIEIKRFDTLSEGHRNFFFGKGWSAMRRDLAK